MLRAESDGVVGLPIVIILCAFLSVLVLGLGMRGLDRAKRLVNDQRAIQSFDKLVEGSTELSYGGVGVKKRIRLELPNSRIHVDGRLIRLRKDNQLKRIEILPLPLRKGFRDEFFIKSGIFQLELECVPHDLRIVEGGELRLRVKGVPDG
ncbi:hypothetical protein AKJ45_02010 [candidate division MSBL1 archaeon SCGC-AAA261F19]|uniref:Uncharacterized protein n=2 Tax=candidate division MSBL1 TaxID=215777 RepID=A0A133V9Y5_9EURY|nr:hypothetical protein AKJ43_01830 [candidate division MSBL1 archaeon SCGC-AAA261D19]KXB03278.1 hypothetical protein AKJ45_02010 [candidate division MSBL1 archaeon SCGC-AAA261F19]